jgi:hypothetical protein
VVSALPPRIEDPRYGQCVCLKLKLNPRLDNNSSTSWDS